MKECNCKEPCEDCKHEENVNLDNISSVLFNDINSNIEAKPQELEKEVKQEVKVQESQPKKETKEKPKKAKKSHRKIECENINYKDPVTEEYKLEVNNKMGFSVWETEIRTFNF